MRIKFLLVFALVTHCINYSASSFTGDLYDTVANKTGYLMKRGRELVHNVKHKVTSYFGEPIEDNEIDSYQSEVNLKRYLSSAVAKDNVLFDEVAPAQPEYKCSNDDPAIDMTTPQLIAMNGYPAESHTVMTDDGYLLTLHRIPFSKYSNRQSPRKTVLLHHGLLGSSTDWVLAGEQKALAYILSDAGYDVWLANVRGNLYSRAHVSRPVNSFEFWNFTWHDVSQHDLPCIIDYVNGVKGWDVKINYIGHSMGTTVLFALLSTKPHYNKRLNAGFALAPVAYMSEIKSPIKVLAPFANNIAYLMKLLGANEFLPQNSVLRWLSKHACEINHYEEVICENSLFVLCGHDPGQFNSSLLPIILGHLPAGASTKSLIHYAQEIHNQGRFQQFDYGYEGNMRQYGNSTPPEYPLDNITLPIALFSANNDWLAGNADVIKLYSKLKYPIEHYIVPLKQFNHVDFLWAIDAPRLVYSRLLELLKKANGYYLA